MIQKDKDGGPAFPCEWDYINSNRAAANGMTLRDYFAAKAMQGMLADGQVMRMIGINDLTNVAYEMADAMLKAREQ